MTSDDSGDTPVMTFRAALSGESTASREARGLVRAQLSQWGLDIAREDLLLITSELVTNAVSYAPGPFELALTTTQDYVQIEISDGGTTPPVPRTANPDHVHGRGLAIIESLASEWGTDVRENGKSVWARLPHLGPNRPDTPHLTG